MDGHLTMREADRLAVMTRLAERRLTQRCAAEQLELSVRQVGRLYRAYRERGAPGLISGHRGRASNRRLANTLQRQALALIRERYHDFGPTLAHEKLTEAHGLRLSVETLRRWMTEAELWVPRARRARRSYQPRERRACVGELVQFEIHVLACACGGRLRFLAAIQNPVVVRRIVRHVGLPTDPLVPMPARPPISSVASRSS